MGPPSARPATPPARRPKARCARRFGRRPVSLAATPGIPFGFSSSGYLDVSVPPVPSPRPMRSAGGRRGMNRAGFARSDIRGSRPLCGSPRLFAAWRVLRRLPVPRHPPRALDIFPRGPETLSFSNSKVNHCLAMMHTLALRSINEVIVSSLRCDQLFLVESLVSLLCAMRLSRCPRQPWGPETGGFCARGKGMRAGSPGRASSLK